MKNKSQITLFTILSFITISSYALKHTVTINNIDPFTIQPKTNQTNATVLTINDLANTNDKKSTCTSTILSILNNEHFKAINSFVSLAAGVIGLTIFLTQNQSHNNSIDDARATIANLTNSFN